MADPILYIFNFYLLKKVLNVVFFQTEPLNQLAKFYSEEG